MADKGAVKAIIAILRERGYQFGSGTDVATGTKRYNVFDVEKAVSAALDAGDDGPTIVEYLTTTGGTPDSLKDRADEREKLQKAQAAAAKQQQQTRSGLQAAGFPVPANASGFSGGGGAPTISEGDPSGALGAAGYRRLSGSGPQARWATPAGAIVTQDEAVAELAALSAPTEDRLRAAGYIAIRPGVYVNPATGDTLNLNTSGGAAAPVARYGFEIGKDGRVFRTNDILGTVEPTDTVIPQGFSNIAVDRSGNLTGLDPSGKFTVIQPNFGFAEIDPAVAAAEQRRRFDQTEGGLNRRNTESEQEENRRAVLSAQTAGFQTLAGLVPQLANVAQNQAQFQKDVISSPADLAYRMFSTRGGTSPFPRVTQADFINQLADEIEKYNQVLQSYRPQPVGFSQPPQTQTTPPGGLTTFTGSEDAPVSPAAGLAGFAAANPGFRVPTVTTPTEPAPITLNLETGKWEQAGQPVNPFDTSGNLVGAQPAASVASPTPTAAPAAAPAPAPVSQGFSYQQPQVPAIPTPQRTTQSEIRAFEQQTRPPAVSSILSGEAPRSLDLGFALPTPQMYGALTPDEKKAFGSTLAIQYDVSPEDVEFAMKRRFGTPNERPVARVVGF